MKKLVSATLISSLVLASCGGDTSDEEEATDDTEASEETSDSSSDNSNSGSSEDDSSGDDNSDSSNDDSSDNSDGANSNDDSSNSEESGLSSLFGNDGDDEKTETDNGETDSNADSEFESTTSTFGNDDDDLIDEEVDPSNLDNNPDGDIVKDDYSVTFLINSNPELIDVINDSEETDLSVDDVLMPQDDVTTYNTSTDLGVFGFLDDNPEPEFFDAVGFRSMVDERSGLKIYAEQYDFENRESVPYAYGDSLTNEIYMNENGQWHDIEGEVEPEEIMYGTYSNVEPILRDDLSDLLEVRETDDYYVLYYLGEDKGIYDSLGDLFSVEFTNANMDEMTTGVFGVINKNTTEFEHLSYITHAPGENPEEFLQIDLALAFQDYGEYDIGLPRPEGLELPE